MEAITVHFFDSHGVIYAVRGYDNEKQAQLDIETLDAEYSFVILTDIETNAH